MATSSQGLKAFVSESEIEEQKKKRQEEWDKVRTAEQPEECPEEEYDPRSLFDKLQQQKDKKQYDFDEQFKFKNMVRGLDDGESEFLEDVSNRQVEHERKKLQEEKEFVQALKERVVKVVDDSSQKAESKQTISVGASSTGSKRSQAVLLAGAVKRRRKTSDEPKEGALSDSDEVPTSETEMSTQNPADRNGSLDRKTQNEKKLSTTNAHKLECIGVLPGIGFYAHSSDDSSNSDTSDEDLTEVIGTVHRSAVRKHAKSSVH